MLKKVLLFMLCLLGLIGCGANVAGTAESKVTDVVANHMQNQSEETVGEVTGAVTEGSTDELEQPSNQDGHDKTIKEHLLNEWVGESSNGLQTNILW